MRSAFLVLVGLLALGGAAAIYFALEGPLPATIGLGLLGVGSLVAAAVKKRPAPAEEELAFAEPLDDEPATEPKPIRGIAGREKRGAFTPPSAHNEGYVKLNSTKYLNGGPGNFRKGTTVHTQDEGGGSASFDA